DDGCPDTGGVEMKLDGDRIAVAKMPTLDKKGGLSAAGDLIVQQISLVMAGHDEVTKWLVAISLPKQAHAQKLGEAIEARLAQRGVTSVEILTSAGSAKIGAVVQERRDGNAPPVCPAGMEVKPRPELATPKATMTPNSKPVVDTPPDKGDATKKPDPKQ